MRNRRQPAVPAAFLVRWLHGCVEAPAERDLDAVELPHSGCVRLVEGGVAQVGVQRKDRLVLGLDDRAETVELLCHPEPPNSDRPRTRVESIIL